MSQVLPDDTAEETLSKYQNLPEDPVHAASQLVRDQVLSAFQAKLLLMGKSKGFRLGEYILRDQIGTGGMGSVYLGLHQTLRRKVAIKILKANPKSEPQAVQRFLREARVAAALDHPNIVRLIEVGQNPAVHYLVMEYIAGETLDKLIEKGPLSLSRAVSYITQAAAGLQYAHEQHILHCDIKPSNLILAKDGSIKILDMGLARWEKTQDGSMADTVDNGQVYGTADFISPEQALNEGEIDTRSDVYSLGATFYALLSGRAPFQGNTATKLVNHQLTEAVPISTIDKTIPKEIEAIIQKMMAKQPKDRFATPADVIVALEPWTNDSVNLAAGLAKTDFGKTGSRSTKRINTAQTQLLVENARKKKKYLLFGGIAAGIVLVGFVVGAAFMMMGKPKASTVSTPKTDTPTVPKPNASKDPTTPPITTKANDMSYVEIGQYYKLDFTQVKPFEKLVGATTSSADPSKTQESLKASTGDLPPQWSLVTWVTGHEARAYSEETPQGTIIGLQAKKGNAMLFWTSPQKWGVPHVKVKMEYRSTCATDKVTLRLRPMGSTTTVNKTIPQSSDWKTIELIFEAEKVGEPRFEFHNQDSGPNAVFQFRKFEIYEVKAES